VREYWKKWSLCIDYGRAKAKKTQNPRPPWAWKQCRKFQAISVEEVAKICNTKARPCLPRWSLSHTGNYF